MTIKAIACSTDLFKESSVVTRTFSVQDVGQPDSDDETELKLTSVGTPSCRKAITPYQCNQMAAYFLCFLLLFFPL